MKTSVLLVACCFVLVSASAEKKAADQGFLQKQQKILQLFVNLNQPNYNAEQAQVGNSYNPANNVEDFTNTLAVKEFVNQQKEGFLQPLEVFSTANPIHFQQAFKLFDLLYFAKDFDTFYKAASYARQNINEFIFDYALRVAVLYRPDTKGIRLPPFSESNPFLFVNSEAIQQAKAYKQRGQKEGIFYSNFSNYGEYDENENGEYPLLHENTETYLNYMSQYKPEGALSYYTNDVSLNEFNAYFFLLNPPSFNSQKYGLKYQNTVYGEEYYYYLQQSLARYNLERLANYLPSVTQIKFNQPIKSAFNPDLQQRNGQAVPARPKNVEFSNANYYYLAKLKDLDRRIRDAVDAKLLLAADGSKVPLTPETGIELLGKAVAANTESVNRGFYSAQRGQTNYFQLFVKTIGSIVDPYQKYGLPQGAISFYASAQRDPVYYQILARVVNIFKSYKDNLLAYQKEQIAFPDVKVQSVNVGNLYTYFDTKDIELFGAVNYQNGEQAENFDYKARQTVLNYKPFVYTINVDSAKDVQAVVRVFIGPKYTTTGQQYSFDQARQNFVEFDRFVVDLKNGQNKVERSSKQSNIFVEDQPTTRALFRQIKQASAGVEQFYFSENPNTYAGFPQNLLLPKGSKYGKEFTFFVIVNQFEPRPNYQGQSFYPNVDNRPFGFPFDRRVFDEDRFENAPNVYYKTVKIYQKNKNEVNNLQ